MNAPPKISIVSPVYRAEKIVDELVRALTGAGEATGETFEIVLVEDGSPDESWQRIEENGRRDCRVKGVKLSRNFGQHYAITAGLEAARGDYAIVIDCDLQDDPAYIPTMYQTALEGYDIVYTVKQARAHSALKNVTARLFYRVFNYLADTKSHGEMVGAYSLLSRKAIDAFLQIRELHRHYLMVLQMIGFRSTRIAIEHRRRFEGKSSYTFSRLLKHSLDGITSQSVKLLRLSITLGFGMVALSVLWALWILVSFFVHGAQPGYTSLMAMMLLSTGLILLSIGITGIYIGNTFEQVKNRPLYIVDRRVNL